ncbi:MAG: hypothetical protein U0793_01365 [Gemmataceae bacterium]
MKTRLLLVAVPVGFLVALAAWALSRPCVAVHDVRRAETLVLGKRTGSPYTHAISIHGSGSIDGDAIISLLLNGRPYKTETLRGAVRFDWGGDWYSETAEVRYEPGEVRSGSITLCYQFHEL